MKTTWFFLSLMVVSVHSLAMTDDSDIPTNNDETSIRLVFLGKTGVGKSTVVNAFYNFAREIGWRDYPKLFPIPTGFQECNVEEFFDIEAECHLGGQLNAVTQFPSEYSVDRRTFHFSFIDCPGMADPRGVFCDNEHASNIAKYLDSKPYFHAFCIVLPCTVNRTTVEERYAIERIKTIMPESALDRIFIIATHDTGGRQNILSFASSMDLPTDNVFYFDNFALTEDGYVDLRDCDISSHPNDDIINDDPFSDQNEIGTPDHSVARAHKVRKSWLQGRKEFGRLVERAAEYEALPIRFDSILVLQKTIADDLRKGIRLFKAYESILAKLSAAEKSYTDFDRAEVSALEAYHSACDDYDRNANEFNTLSPEERRIRWAYYQVATFRLDAVIISKKERWRVYANHLLGWGKSLCDWERKRQTSRIERMSLSLMLRSTLHGTMAWSFQTLCEAICDYIDICIRRELTPEKKGKTTSCTRVLA